MPDTPGQQSTDLHFLNGGGQMGQLTRSFDWAKTALGAPAHWPQSLKTTLSIMLNSKFPMFLWWGPQLICFYNDAYRPSLGKDGKHPSILGMPAAEAWPEIWTIIEPLIKQVLAGGESTWSEDQLIPIYRNGQMEDVYWTFSYSPVKDETGLPAGVFVTCTETTAKVIASFNLKQTNEQLQQAMETDRQAQRQIKENVNNLQLIIHQAPMAIAIFRGLQYVVETVNTRALELWGRKEAEVLNQPILEALPELKSQGIKDLLDDVYKNGNSFSATELPIQLARNKQIETAYINFIYEPLYDADGVINGLITIGFDITDQVIAREAVEGLNNELAAMNEELTATNEELRLTNDELKLAQDNYILIYDELEKSQLDLMFAIDAAALGTWDLDPATYRFRGNEVLKLWFGLQPDDEIDLSNATNVIAESDRERVISAIEKALDYRSGGNYV
jgi:two-component system sensor histidine kinase VicK